ncbi:MAG: HD domain-containing protein [Puniceicoccales bacterium]|jgi:3'-5' exoribonuclease|nr:HD domain-containing protein [Puniceicoccales bacterium]
MIDIANNPTILDIISSDSDLKFSTVAVIKSVETKLAKNNAEYLSVTIGDKNATCLCKVFGSSPTYNFFKTVESGAIVLLEGITKDYKGVFSPEITFVRALSDDEIVRGNYLQKMTICADEGVDTLRTGLNDMLATIGNEKLRLTATEAIKELGEDFYDKAAGISMHHAYKNGLLEHTVHTARAGKSLLPLYPFVNYDIAMAGLLLHDIGKVLEYTNDVVAQRTKIGILQGHLILGYRLVRKAAIQNKLDGEILERLEHILLSHHNDPEFGAVVRPATPEAVFVALVDNLDAKMGMVEQLLRSTPSKNIFSDFHKGLEGKLLVLPADLPVDGESN